METMKSIQPKDECLKRDCIIEYDSYSNSGSTYYGREITCGGRNVGRKDVIYFEKYYSDMTIEEKEKYKDVINEAYNNRVQRILDFNYTIMKTIRYINKHISNVNYPFYYFDNYDSARISINSNNKINDNESLTVINSEIELRKQCDYFITHVVFAFTENKLQDCGYEYDDIIMQTILKK